MRWRFNYAKNWTIYQWLNLRNLSERKWQKKDVENVRFRRNLIIFYVFLLFSFFSVSFFTVTTMNLLGLVVVKSDFILKYNYLCCLWVHALNLHNIQLHNDSKINTNQIYCSCPGVVLTLIIITQIHFHFIVLGFEILFSDKVCRVERVVQRSLMNTYHRKQMDVANPCLNNKIMLQLFQLFELSQCRDCGMKHTKSKHFPLCRKTALLTMHKPFSWK